MSSQLTKQQKSTRAIVIKKQEHELTGSLSS